MIEIIAQRDNNQLNICTLYSTLLVNILSLFPSNMNCLSERRIIVACTWGGLTYVGLKKVNYKA